MAHPLSFAPSPNQKNGGGKLKLDRIDHDNHKLNT